MVLTKPAGGVILQGTPLTDNRVIETVTDMYPGRLAIKGTADKQITVCGAAGKAIGWIGYEETAAPFKDGHTVDTIYSTDKVAIHYGGHFVIVGRLASGQSVAAGEYLTSAASGELTAATVGTHHVYAIAAETVDATSAAADIAVISLL